MAKKRMLIVIGASITCLMFMIQVCPGPGSLKLDLSWMEVLKNLSSLIKTEDDSLFFPSSPRCHPAGSNRPFFLVAVVCSSTFNFAARRAIRATWANKSFLRSDVGVFFIIGRSLDSAADEFVSYEHDVYGDIIRYDMVDSYRNLTVKSVMMLQWVKKYCKEVEYVLKSDDDMFVHLENLVYYLITDGRKNLLMGHVIANALPVKESQSKWYTPISAFAEVVFPNYLSGTGYVMSQDVVRLIYSRALTIPFFYLEDVFITGICARASGLVPEDHNGFSYKKRINDPCLFRDIVTAHRMSQRDLYQMWYQLQDSSIHCTKWRFMRGTYSLREKLKLLSRWS